MTQISKINGIPVVNTSVSAFTYDGTNQFTIGSTDGGNYNASIDVLSATTFSGVTFYGDGSNLTGVSGVDTYTTGLTFNNNILLATNSTGGTYSTVIDNFTGLTVNGSISATTISATTFYGDGSSLAGVGENNTASNLAATGFFGQKNGVDLEFKGLTSTGSTVTITTDGTTVNVENAAGGGESNTASNVGGANNVFYQKSGVDLQFRTLSAGTNVTITSGTTALTINATGGGGSSRVTGSTQTTNATPTEVDKINTLTDNTTNIVEVYIKAYETAAAEYGVWKRTLTVTSVGGTVVIREINADVDKTSTGLNANSLTFTVNGGDIDIDVTGIAATTIDWESAYEIIL